MSESDNKTPTVSPDQGATSATATIVPKELESEWLQFLKQKENEEMNNKSQEKWFQLLKLEDTLKALIGWMFGLLEIIRKIWEVEDSQKAEQMKQLPHVMHGSLGTVDGLHIIEKWWRSLFQDLKVNKQ